MEFREVTGGVTFYLTSPTMNRDTEELIILLVMHV